MKVRTDFEELTYQQRLDSLRATKLEQTQEKQKYIGSMDYDDWGLILPPPDRREFVQLMGPSGVPITDCLLKGFQIKSKHPSGGFFGPKIVGENFRALMEQHPTYIDPMSSLAGGYMVNFFSYRQPHWNPDFDYDHIRPEIEKYKIQSGIGAIQHFCQDLKIGLDLGWGGILKKIRHYRQVNAPHGSGFYDGLENVVLGIQNWIGRHVEAAREMAKTEAHPQLRANLSKIAEMNEWLISGPPRTFREVCQWILSQHLVGLIYNLSGSLGRLDVFLNPYYERDIRAGILTDQEAIFHIACILLRDSGLHSARRT